MFDSETDCTIDTDIKMGNCVAKVLRPATQFFQGNPILGGETEKFPFTTTIRTVWDGTPTPIATVTGVITSGQRVTSTISLAGIVVALFFVLSTTLRI